MTVDDKIRDKKLQYDINREGAKTPELSYGKSHKYEYLTGKEMLTADQRRVIKQAGFSHFSLGKAFEKKKKTIEDQGKKQIKVLEKNGK